MRYVMLLFLVVPFVLYASPWSSTRKGITEYEKGNFDGALEKFREAELDDPVSPIVHFNIASALYKQNKYDKAIAAYMKAVEKAKEPAFLAKIWYGLGNAYFKSDSLLKAIECYKRSLEYDPNDKDAKYNLELARALLKELAKKEQQPSQGQTQASSSQQQSAGSDSTSADSTKTQASQGEEKQEEISKEDAERILNMIDQADKNLQNQREVPIRGREYHEKDW